MYLKNKLIFPYLAFGLVFFEHSAAALCDTCYADPDGDGYYTSTAATTAASAAGFYPSGNTICTCPVGFTIKKFGSVSSASYDCDGANAARHPRAIQLAGGVDNNCDSTGTTNEPAWSYTNLSVAAPAQNSSPSFASLVGYINNSAIISAMTTGGSPAYSTSGFGFKMLVTTLDGSSVETGTTNTATSVLYPTTNSFSLSSPQAGGTENPGAIQVTLNTTGLIANLRPNTAYKINFRLVKQSTPTIYTEYSNDLYQVTGGSGSNTTVTGKRLAIIQQAFHELLASDYGRVGINGTDYINGTKYGSPDSADGTWCGRFVRWVYQAADPTGFVKLTGTSAFVLSPYFIQPNSDSNNTMSLYPNWDTVTGNIPSNTYTSYYNNNSPEMTQYYHASRGSTANLEMGDFVYHPNAGYADDYSTSGKHCSTGSGAHAILAVSYNSATDTLVTIGGNEGGTGQGPGKVRVDIHTGATGNWTDSGNCTGTFTQNATFFGPFIQGIGKLYSASSTSMNNYILFNL